MRARAFLLNHLEHEVKITDAALRGFDLLSEKECVGTLSLLAKGVSIIRRA